jgi:hypothetical protein
MFESTRQITPEKKNPLPLPASSHDDSVVWHVAWSLYRLSHPGYGHYL